MAHYYDMIYHELVDYEADCDFIQKIFREHAKGTVRSILDIGCGTGNHAFILAKRRYSVTGIDVSKEMINAARKKAEASGASNPVFHRMDMRKINLGTKFDAGLVMFGGFGYLLKDSDVVAFFSSARKHVRDLLVCEFWHNSGVLPQAFKPSRFRTWDRIEDKKENLLLIRLNTSTHDAQTNLETIDFDFYVMDTKEKRFLDMFSERHVTRTYSITEMKRLLEDNGFTPLGFYIGELNKKMLKPATQLTFRVMCVAKPSRR
jgi:SAM-dependent methyltransferase